jgi:hypothetical protein
MDETTHPPQALRLFPPDALALPLRGRTSSRSYRKNLRGGVLVDKDLGGSTIRGYKGP